MIVPLLAVAMVACFQGVFFSPGDLLLVGICGVTWRRGLNLGVASAFVGGLTLGAAQGNLACLRGFHYVVIAFLAEKLEGGSRTERVYAVGSLSCLSILVQWGLAWWLEDSYSLGSVGVAATVTVNCFLAFFLPGPLRS